MAKDHLHLLETFFTSSFDLSCLGNTGGKLFSFLLTNVMQLTLVYYAQSLLCHGWNKIVRRLFPGIMILFSDTFARQG